MLSQLISVVTGTFIIPLSGLSINVQSGIVTKASVVNVSSKHPVIFPKPL